MSAYVADAKARQFVERVGTGGAGLVQLEGLRGDAADQYDMRNILQPDQRQHTMQMQPGLNTGMKPPQMHRHLSTGRHQQVIAQPQYNSARGGHSMGTYIENMKAQQFIAGLSASSGSSQSSARLAGLMALWLTVLMTPWMSAVIAALIETMG